MYEASPTAYSAPAVSIASEEITGSGGRRKKLLLAGGGLLILLLSYVVLGATTGLTFAGINFFPFVPLLEKIGVSRLLEAYPTPTPLVLKPSPSATPTPSPTPMTLNGRVITLSGPDADVSSLQSLAWSADIQKAAYTTLTEKGNLWVLDVVSRAKENLFEKSPAGLTGNLSVVSLSWSPQKDLIAFVAKQESGIANLYTIDVLGKSITALTNAATPEESVSVEPSHAPQWKPDASALLYVSGGNIWTAASVGGIRTQLTSGLPVGSARWSPDGKEILYTIRRTSTESVWLMDADGKNYRALTAEGINRNPQFGPDGASILYTARDTANAKDRLMVMGRDGANPRELSTVGYAIKEFSWSPDGNRVSFVNRAENGRQTLWMLKRDGTDIEEILGPGEYEPMGFHGWSRRGDTLFAVGAKHFIISAALRPDEIAPAASPAPAPSPTTSPSPTGEPLPTTSPML